MSRPVLLPSETHPITIQPTDQHVVVRVGDTVVAETDRALGLAEASYPVAQYIPIADVNESLLRDSTTETYCPFKGDASYYDVVTDTAEVKDAVWYYASPHPAVAEIAEHVCFYPDRVSITVE